jgi:formate C-acetyltransferase
MTKYKAMMKWLAQVYVNALNIIHYMHDKYSYERLQMALHDKHVRRWFATGIAGFSVVADSLSAIKYGKVRVVRNEQGIVTDYITEGDFPKFGNDDDRVDSIAKEVLHTFVKLLRQNSTYRDGIITTSLLTITSNVSYGKNTGSTPDGRKQGEAFAPVANTMHGRDTSGSVASMASVAKIPFMDSQDGISNTFTIVPSALGKEEDEQRRNLVALLDGYTKKGGFHLNVNVFDRERLLDAQKHPEKYPQLTIRVSGYAVNFIKLTKEQQDEVISRTFHCCI